MRGAVCRGGHFAGRDEVLEAFRAAIDIEVLQHVEQCLGGPEILSFVPTDPDALGIPRVSGMPLLLGTNPKVTFDDIDRLLERIDPDGTR